MKLFLALTAYIAFVLAWVFAIAFFIALGLRVAGVDL